MRLLGLALAVLVAGCTTTYDVKQKPPRYVGESPRSAREVMFCFTERLEKETRGTPYNVLETRTGYEVNAVCNYGYPCYVALIDRNGTGARATVHAQGGGSDMFIKILKRCTR